jgi:hypothetical protein
MDVGHRHAPAALLLGKTPGTDCMGGWVGLGVLETRKTNVNVAFVFN